MVAPGSMTELHPSEKGYAVGIHECLQVKSTRALLVIIGTTQLVINSRLELKTLHLSLYLP